MLENCDNLFCRDSENVCTRFISGGFPLGRLYMERNETSMFLKPKTRTIQQRDFSFELLFVFLLSELGVRYL